MLYLLGIVVALVAAVITYYKWSFQYWKSKGLKYVEPSIPFGNFDSPFVRTKNMAVSIKDFYDDFKKQGCKHFGIYTMAKPTYVPIDLDYVRNIMTKDFQHFVDRGVYYNEKDDPLSAHLFAIGGAKWRNLRIKMTPTFTSGKMKMMFPVLVECGGAFKELMDTKIDNNEAIDIKEELGRFTTDIIGNCAFGLSFNTIKKDNSPFRKHGRAIFERTRLGVIRSAVSFNFPSLARILRLRSIPKEAADFLMNVVKDNLRYREENNISRNDFFQILIDLKNRKLDHEMTEQHDGKSLTVEELAAQCFVFFVAGFETSSTTMTFALLEMCKNPETQEKAREEINRVLEKHNGEITYEAMHEMKYLGQVIDEALRMYPPVPFVTRECVQDYKVPDDDLMIEKGMKVIIPIYGIHRDEEYYPNPDKFDPERFSEENKKGRHPYAHIPFGEGPRICIGMRFGIMQSKVGLTLLLKNYRFTLDKKTPSPAEFSVTSFVLTVEGGVWLRGERI